MKPTILIVAFFLTPFSQASAQVFPTMKETPSFEVIYTKKNCYKNEKSDECSFEKIPSVRSENAELDSIVNSQLHEHLLQLANTQRLKSAYGSIRYSDFGILSIVVSLNNSTLLSYNFNVETGEEIPDNSLLNSQERQRILDLVSLEKYQNDDRIVSKGFDIAGDSGVQKSLSYYFVQCKEDELHFGGKCDKDKYEEEIRDLILNTGEISLINSGVYFVTDYNNRIFVSNNLVLAAIKNVERKQYFAKRSNKYRFQSNGYFDTKRCRIKNAAISSPAEREIELDIKLGPYDEKKCEVTYRKYKVTDETRELSSEQTLWSAKNDMLYCIREYEKFDANLATMGWFCEPDEYFQTYESEEKYYEYSPKINLE